MEKCTVRMIQSSIDKSHLILIVTLIVTAPRRSINRLSLFTESNSVLRIFMVMAQIQEVEKIRSSGGTKLEAEA